MLVKVAPYIATHCAGGSDGQTSANGADIDGDGCGNHIEVLVQNSHISSVLDNEANCEWDTELVSSYNPDQTNFPWDINLHYAP